MAVQAQGKDLFVFNSLGRKKEKFTPIDPAGNAVTWYCCGPTVYDAGHLGHARNYVTTDYLRRILKFYFKYNVKFVMNITDVDDKIIVRARQQYLLKRFLETHPDPSSAEVLENAVKAFHAYSSKNLPLLAHDLAPEDFEQDSGDKYGEVLRGGTISGEGSPGDQEAKIKMHLKTLSSAARALVSAGRKEAASSSQFYSMTSDVFLPYLDSLQSHTIKSTDYSIFTDLTQYWEKKFDQDLGGLNCLPPDEITRVTEYMPQIVDFVSRIVKNGFAYSTEDGSVYFDIAAFEAAGNQYARLEPWNRNDKELQADGEGSLSKKKASEKKSDADFALWKASKQGEPSWDSPWGEGRPGWHIECSAMASDRLGSHIDIHSGGIDLAFPHHDNELAQSEAYWTEGQKRADEPFHQHQWINYFFHMGHLSIQGSKMSKSLKNFTTIEAALRTKGGWTSRSLRVVFLMGAWKERIEVTDDLVKSAKAWESTVNNFFWNVQALLAEEADMKNFGSESSTLPTEPEAVERKLEAALKEWINAPASSETISGLTQSLEEAQISFDEALRDSFNTPAAMAIISNLINKTNLQISSLKFNSLLSVKRIAQWITSMLNIFGLDSSDPSQNHGDAVGWSKSLSKEDEAAELQEAGRDLKNFVTEIAAFRERYNNILRSLDLSDDQKAEYLHLGSSKLQLPSRSTTSEDLDVAAFNPYVRSVARFRDILRETTRALPSAPKKSLLLLTDDLRDSTLARFGVQLEDRETGLPSLVKFVPKAELVAAREQARQELQLQDQKKREAKAERERAELAKLEKGKLSPLEMFKGTGDFSAWDEEGMPTKDKEGQEIAKNRVKKLRKEWERQKKAHELWLAAATEVAGKDG
ncbi:MAG: 3',5'-cyclic-nucleotide phosphodiesterase (PDEase) (3':5'-CNP) [Chaenotheca gracillima]|nr:MAG: 3',5'-cyclic-nucleotide phosphodiesterase (PDEase) (3':5'-CNP) [Chaenotheca gracillima]